MQRTYYQLPYNIQDLGQIPIQILELFDIKWKIWLPFFSLITT